MTCFRWLESAKDNCSSSAVCPLKIIVVSTLLMGPLGRHLFLNQKHNERQHLKHSPHLRYPFKALEDPTLAHDAFASCSVLPKTILIRITRTLAEMAGSENQGFSLQGFRPGPGTVSKSGGAHPRRRGLPDRQDRGAIPPGACCRWQAPAGGGGRDRHGVGRACCVGRAGRGGPRGAAARECS